MRMVCSFKDEVIRPILHGGLEEEFREMFGSGGRSQLFAITEEAYKDVTLEVLNTIKVEHHFISFDRPYSRRFQLFGEQRS